MNFIKWGFILFILLFNVTASPAQPQKKEDAKLNEDSLRKARAILTDARVSSKQREIKIIIRNVDITEFPTIKVIVEAFNIYGSPLDTLMADDLKVKENNVEKSVISVEKISNKERVPVDFVFVIDQTGSMQSYIDAVRKHLTSFTRSVVKRGIDYRIGLVLFSDYIEKVYNPTENVNEFLGWLGRVKAKLGGDAKENALDALAESIKLDFRPSADKVMVLITDAPYHQRGENGQGHSDFTTETIIQRMVEHDVRLFSIVPPRLKNYNYISRSTRGTMFDIDYPFSTILNSFSNQLTNLYALKYRTDEAAIPDSINIALLNSQKKELVKRTIPIIELGRKLIIENLLYPSGSSDIPKTVKELEVLTNFMLNKPNVVIMVEGHTDSDGSFKLNDKLSLKRAKSVRKYLIQKGVSPDRIKTKGYGERKPIASNDSDFGKKLNRRTEIVIVAK